MFTAFSRAFAQLPDPAFRGVLARALGLTLALFIILGMAAGYGLSLVPAFGWSWINTLVDWLAGAGLVAASVFLLLPVASIFGALFMDRVASAVEAKHYPGGPAAKGQSIAEGLVSGLAFFGTMVLYNLLALPFYFLFPPAIWVLNGWLIGREYFELAAFRHHSPKEAKAMRRASRPQLLMAGIPLALLMSVPIVNFIAPVFATAVMVHVYWRARNKAEARQAAG